MNGLGHRSIWRGRASVHRRFWKEPDIALFYPTGQAEQSSRGPSQHPQADTREQTQERKTENWHRKCRTEKSPQEIVRGIRAGGARTLKAGWIKVGRAGGREGGVPDRGKTGDRSISSATIHISRCFAKHLATSLIYSSQPRSEIGIVLES